MPGNLCGRWRFPVAVDGWLTRREGWALSRLAAGRTVVEIGSYCGRSTIAMAQTARLVLSIDPHDGRGTPRQRRTQDVFLRNLARYRVQQRVVWRNSTSAYFGETYTGPLFEMAFIDAAHDYASVAADWRVVERVTIPKAIVAFHDFGAEAGVTRLVRALIDEGRARWLGVDGTVAVLGRGFWQNCYA